MKNEHFFHNVELPELWIEQEFTQKILRHAKPSHLKIKIHQNKVYICYANRSLHLHTELNIETISPVKFFKKINPSKFVMCNTHSLKFKAHII